MEYRCEYRDVNRKACDGSLKKVDKYEQYGNLVTVYECEKCGEKTSFIDM